MNPLKDLGALLTDPTAFYEKYQGDVVGVVKLLYVYYLPFALLGGLAALAINPRTGFLWLLGALIFAAIAIPIGISILGAINHLAVLVLGGRGIKNTITVTGAAILISLPYSIASGLVFFALPIVGFFLSYPISLAAFIHAAFAQTKGYDVHYQWGLGRGIAVAVAWPILLWIIIGALSMIFGLAYFMSMDPAVMMPPA